MRQTLMWNSRRWRRAQKTHRLRAAALLVVMMALAGVIIGAAVAAVVALIVTWAQSLST